MRTRRTLALSTALCLLLSLLALPQGPWLVCRVTGTPMAPVAVAKTDAAAAKGSCCDVATTVRPDGVARAELTAPGCCELRPGVERTVVPAVTNQASELSVAVLADVPSSAPAPCMIAAVLSTPVAKESAPRAPPIRYSSPRAPPSVS